MRWLLLASALVVAGCASLSPEAPNRAHSIRAELHDPSGGMLIVAHRTCWREAPENSVKAIAACIDMGVHLIEIDVRQTADGELVVIHNRTVDRTTHGTGRVADLSLAELKSLRLREGQGGPHAPLTEARIPTLREALEAARGNVLICLDVKDPVHDEVFELVSEMGLLGETLLLWLAQADDPVLSVAAFNGKMMVKPSVNFTDAREDSAVLADYLAMDPVALTLDWKDTERFSWAKSEVTAARKRVWATTLRPEDDVAQVWAALAAIGVTLIQTDRPRAAMAWLESTELSRLNTPSSAVTSAPPRSARRTRLDSWEAQGCSSSAGVPFPCRQ